MRGGKGRRSGDADRGHASRLARLILFTRAILCAVMCGTALIVPAQHLQLATYGAAAGLANLNVAALLEDHSGAVWVGTESGVYLADGERFLKQTAFSQAGLELIVTLREDADGRIWAMDRRHLVFWDGTSIHEIAGLNLRNISVEGRDLIMLPGERNAIFLLVAGRLLRIASTDGGHSWTTSPAIGPELLTRHPELQKLSSVAAAEHSTVWAGCGFMLCRLDLGSGSGTVQSFGTAAGVPADAWKALLPARDGTLWARGAKGLVRLRKGAEHFEEVTVLPPRVSLSVSNPLVVEDQMGEIVLNVSDGIARSSRSSSGMGWQLYTHGNGLPEGEMQAMLFDRTGELWLAPEGLGLSRWPGYGLWEGWSKAEGLRSNVLWSSAQTADGSVWALTGEGLDRLDRLDRSDPATHRFVPAKSDLLLRHLKVAAVDARQHLWMGDADGRVLDYDPVASRARIAAEGLGKIIHLTIDRRQRVWVCSQAGLRFFLPEEGWTIAHEPDARALPAGYAWSLVEGRDGTLWLSNGQGLFRLDGGAWTKIALPFPGGTEYNFLLAPAADGTLWVQSKQPFPLLRLRVEGTRARIVERVPGASFGSDNLTFMKTDGRGWLWVGSDDGVHVFNGRRWVQATSDDGMTWDDTDFQAFSAAPDGTVWIGTSNGLAHLLHPERLFEVMSPVARLGNARLGEEQVRGNDPSFDLRRPALSVSLLNTNYSRGSAVVYRYRLEGQENEWQQDSDGQLRFPALNAGSYRLTAVAYDSRLHEESAPVTLTFTVLEPWWRRTWFRWIELGCGLLLGAAVWRLSVHLLVKRQQALQRLIASRTRELEREKAELLSTRSALLEMTRRDSLTGLLNRAAIFARMSALCEASLESGRPLALAMADLDYFKRINDRHGHVMGDTVLRECARRIEGAVRPEDAVGRYGGEELLILMPGLHPESAASRMEQLRAAIAGTPIAQGETSLTVTCSFGVAWMGAGGCSLESLVELADAALYRAKQNGRNRVEFALTACATTPPVREHAVAGQVQC